ncbi:hypothetical protein NFJ02_24g56230 [Pycnococcus provasolii]
MESPHASFATRQHAYAKPPAVDGVAVWCCSHHADDEGAERGESIGVARSIMEPGRGEQRPEQPLLNDEEREDLVVIAQNSPLASQRLSARRALLDDATLRHQQMEETTTATASSPGMRVLVARARRERDMAQQALDNERTTAATPSSSFHSQGSESPTPTPPLQQVDVHEDNSAAIQILGDRRYDGRTKQGPRTNLCESGIRRDQRDDTPQTSWRKSRRDFLVDHERRPRCAAWRGPRSENGTTTAASIGEEECEGRIDWGFWLVPSEGCPRKPEDADSQHKFRRRSCGAELYMRRARGASGGLSLARPSRAWHALVMLTIDAVRPTASASRAVCLTRATSR